METSEFLRLVWPAQGPYLIAIPISFIDKQTQQTVHTYKHFLHDDLQSAADQAEGLSIDHHDPQNVFYALGSLKEKREKGARKGDNIAKLKAFWFDLDVKPDPKNYATKKEAAAHLRDFCRAMQLPKPYLVDSGGGIHVYWPLTEELDCDKWKHYADLLKAIAKSWGLKQDPSRTADYASVLRPVGTYNWKTGEPREVKVVVEGQVTTTNAFLKRIAQIAESAQLKAPTASQERREREPATTVAPTIGGTRPDAAGAAVDINAGATSGIGSGYTEADAKKVVSRCQQLKWQASHQGEVDQSSWYAMVGVIRHCARGAEAVHLLSRKHPDYSAVATDAKIDQHVAGGYGPSLCTSFENHRPGGCQGCPHQGKIKSPIVLGREMLAVAPPKTVISLEGNEVEIDLPDPPAPYKRAVNPETNKARIVRMEDNEDGVSEVEIYEFDVYPVRLIFDEREQGYRVVLKRWLPKDGEQEFQLQTGLMYDRRRLAGALGSVGVMPDPGMIDDLVQYMVAYIRELQRRSKSTTIYAQLGWRSNEQFVLPDRVVTATGYETVKPSASIANALSWDKHRTRGDVEQWKKIVSVYERPGMEGFQFAFGVGFAAPLFHMTNYNGMIVSLVGSKGCGKSSAAMCAASIWGHKKSGWIDLQHDTQRAFYGMLGVMNNLPVIYDEITNLEPDVLSDLCYAISKGQGRQRLKQTGESQENHGNWQTMMLTTSNAGLHGRLANLKGDSSAESVRVFEYGLPDGTLTKEEADDTFDALNDHYGVAAPAYVLAMLQRYAWARDRVKYWSREIDKRANVSSGERFWSAAPACVLTGFELANDIGLTNCDIDRLAAFAVRTIQNMRVVVEEGSRTPITTVAEYMNRNIRNTLSLRDDPKGTAVPMTLIEPVAELRIRVEVWHGRVMIDRAHFRKFCADQQIDAKMVQKSLTDSGALLEDSRRVVLGKGTKWHSAQVPCWVLDLNHPMFGSSPVRAVQDVVEDKTA